MTRVSWSSISVPSCKFRDCWQVWGSPIEVRQVAMSNPAQFIMVETLRRWPSKQPGAKTNEADCALAYQGLVGSKWGNDLDGGAELFLYLSN